MAEYNSQWLGEEALTHSRAQYGPTTNTSHWSLLTMLKRLYRSGKHSDLKVVCGPYHFALHKAIVCEQSEYFSAACKEGRFKEGITKVIELKALSTTPYDTTTSINSDDIGDDDPEVVKLMFHFLYYHRLYDYHWCGPAEPSVNPSPHISWSSRPSNSRFDNGDSLLLMYAKAFAIALKYQVPTLQTLAARKFERGLVALVESCRFELDEVKDQEPVAERPVADVILEAIEWVYSNTPIEARTLRDTITTMLRDNSMLVLDEGILGYIRDTPELCFDLLYATMMRNTGVPVGSRS